MSSSNAPGPAQSGLDAAGKAWGIDAVITINIVTCSLVGGRMSVRFRVLTLRNLQSLVGALVMIIPFFVSKHLRKVRHRMILGLAVNDLVQAVTVSSASLASRVSPDAIHPQVLVPSAYLTSRPVKRMRTDSPGCIADSFFYLALVVAGCLWALA